MDEMASIANFGENPQNCYRALKQLLGLPKGAPPFEWAKIPTSSGDRWHPFLMPHEFFHRYYLGQQGKWAGTITGPANAALQFWRSMAKTDFMRLHPSLPQAHWATTVPLGLHGDGASFSKHDSIYVFSWNSLIGSGTTVQKRFVATIIRKTDMAPGTIDAIMKVLSWSFNSMLDGRMPAMDWAGNPLPSGGSMLADGWMGALCQVRGDWAFFCELFAFPKWNGAQRMCFLCKASSTDAALAWVKFGPDAGWRRTRWTHESYLRFLRLGGLAIPALLCMAIGFRLECVMVDVLHTVDQGVASHIIANIMWVFAAVRGVLGGANQQDRIKKLHLHIKKCIRRKRYRSCKGSSLLSASVPAAAGPNSRRRLRPRDTWPDMH